MDGKGQTYPIAATMHAQVRGQRDGGAEPEEHVQRVERDADDWDVEVVEEGGREQVEEGGHAEDRGEHDVVYHGGVAGDGGGDHVADEGHYDEGAEELWDVSFVCLVVWRWRWRWDWGWEGCSRVQWVMDAGDANIPASLEGRC